MKHPVNLSKKNLITPKLDMDLLAQEFVSLSTYEARKQLISRFLPHGHWHILAQQKFLTTSAQSFSQLEHSNRTIKFIESFCLQINHDPTAIMVFPHID